MGLMGRQALSRRNRGIAAASGIGVFLLSLPAMYQIGVFAMFAFGFGVWIVPWILGATLGTMALPQGALNGLIRSEFDGAIIFFAFFAAVQNALFAWLIVRWALQGRQTADAAALAVEADTDEDGAF